MKPTIEQCLRFLEKHKHLFGFADWSIKVKRSNQDVEAVAEIDTSFWEKELVVTLNEKFYQRDDWKETLIHELIHGRIAVYQDKAEFATRRVIYQYEEEAVNDITRGFMEYIK